ncbi:hypothetical protein [Nocardia abscessus]|nr:hypothetical protein [Nocardia abscessus]
MLFPLNFEETVGRLGGLLGSRNCPMAGAFSADGGPESIRQ